MGYLSGVQVGILTHAPRSRYRVQELSGAFMVVRNSVTFSVTRIGGHVNRGKAPNHPGWTTLIIAW